MTTDFAPRVSVLTEQPAVLTPPDLSLDGLLARFPGLADADAIAITGSIAAGFGNPFSDIDLYAFSDARMELPADETSEMWESRDSSGATRTTWMGRYGDSRVDLKLWPTDTPRKALASFLVEPEPEFCEIGLIVQDFIYRLSIAQPVKGDRLIAEAKELIEASSFRRALARDLKLAAENKLTDVAGQLLSGDLPSARLSAIQAAARAADCCLVLAGDYCRGQKWMLRRLEKTPECGISVAEYSAMTLDGPLPGESLEANARRVAHWVRTTLASVEIAALGR